MFQSLITVPQNKVRIPYDNWTACQIVLKYNHVYIPHFKLEYFIQPTHFSALHQHRLTFKFPSEIFQLCPIRCGLVHPSMPPHKPPFTSPLLSSLPSLYLLLSVSSLRLREF